MAIRLVKNAKFLERVGKEWRCCSSQVIADAFKQHKGILSEAEASELVAQVLLLPDEVRIWLKHLQGVIENRKEGARKVAQRGERHAEKELF